MCSIEEAWAGQEFGGKHVTSQGDIRKAYMEIPNNLLNRNNEFSINKSNLQPPRDYSRGVNSQRSRSPRISNISKNTNDGNINFTTVLPPENNYGGLNPRPNYMQLYDQTSGPVANQGSDRFTDISDAFNVSETVNEFMDPDNNTTITQNPLLNEDTDEEVSIINSKNNSKNQNKSNFLNIKDTRVRKYNSSNSNNNREYDNDNIDSNISSNITSNITSNSSDILALQMALQQILFKLDKIEQDLHSHNSRNLYDIAIYILIGMILSFMLYSMFRHL